jgi:hypothetical protein
MPERRRSPEIERLVEGLVRRLTEIVEATIAARTRVLTEDYLRAAVAAAHGMAPRPLVVPALVSPMAEDKAFVLARSPDVPPLGRRPRQTRQRPAVVADTKVLPHIDQEQERRAAELARVRAILRPTVPVPQVPPMLAPATPPPAAADDGGLRALEDQIRDHIPALAGLSQSRYTARAASWVGRVRLHQSGPDGERTRIASRILFDKLRNLAWSMEAGTIEGLNTSWSTRNWERYIEENERIAATPDALPSKPESEPRDIWFTPDAADPPA